MTRHASMRHAAATARRQKPALLAQSRQVFIDWRAQIDDADISFEKESATQRKPDTPLLPTGNQSHIANSGSYVLRLINRTGRDYDRISVSVPNRTKLLLTSHGIVTVSAPLERESGTDAQQTLWTPERDIRFFDEDDIGRQTDMRFGRVQTGDGSLEISAPNAYFSGDAQALIDRMFSRCVEVIGEEQHSVVTSRVCVATGHPTQQP